MIDLNRMKDVLAASTSYPFACYAWAKTPDGQAWGVVNLVAQDGARWGDNKMCEQLLTGQVHLFTRGMDATAFNAVQDALASLDLSWRLSAAQYEQDTHLLHYTWMWTEGGLLA